MESTNISSIDGYVEMQDIEIQTQIYNLYKQTDVARLFATKNVEGWQKVHIDVPGVGTKRLQRLPAYPDKHVRGFLESRYARFMINEIDEPLPLRLRSTGLNRLKDLPKQIIFHSQPTNSVYSDIPDRLELYLFLKHRHRQLISIGRNSIAILEKGDATNGTILRLWDWESSHPHHKSRIRKRHKKSENEWQILKRYAAASLRGVGLEWPGKKSKRRKHWPDCFRNLGIDVVLVDRIVD